MLVFENEAANKKPRFFKFAGKFLWTGVRKIKVTVNEGGIGCLRSPTSPPSILVSVCYRLALDCSALSVNPSFSGRASVTKT
jgi:hypothetical protein